jgi:hypothetical protein
VHAVVVDVTINDYDSARKQLDERVVPMVKQQPGFVSGVWFNPSEGKGRSVMVFDSEDAANAAVEVLREGPQNDAVSLDNVVINPVAATA